nr:DUF559 domain-containing protein [uncultured Halomonas sp.]
MNQSEWLEVNKSKLSNSFEELFVLNVLSRLKGFDYSTLTAQLQFFDLDRKRRFCDFVIVENSNVRVAIEIDGYDKRGNGTGMSHDDFVDWQRRHAALVSQGWDVIRFANRDVRDDPRRCAYLLSLVIKRARESGLTEEEKAKLNKLELYQQKIHGSERETRTLKTTVWALTTIITVGMVLFATITLGPHAFEEDIASVKRYLSFSTPPGIDAGLPGDSCSNPISWQLAGDHVGESKALVGKVESITSREDVSGRPLWIDLGESFPSPRRLNLVIWGDDQDKFSYLVSAGILGENVCVHGDIQEYRGVSQIIVRDEWQLMLAK